MGRKGCGAYKQPLPEGKQKMTNANDGAELASPVRGELTSRADVGICISMTL